MAAVLGLPLSCVDQLPASEMETWRAFHDEYAGLMLPSEAAGTVAAAVANFQGKRAKSHLEPEDFLLLSPARREEIRARRDLVNQRQAEERATVDALNARITQRQEEARRKQKGQAGVN